MGKTKGARTRRILVKAIENGMLITWISAKDLALNIGEQYDSVPSSQPGRNTRHRETRLTTTEVATNLGILHRKGLVEMKRAREGVTALWRAEPEP